MPYYKIRLVTPILDQHQVFTRIVVIIPVYKFSDENDTDVASGKLVFRHLLLPACINTTVQRLPT